MTGSRFRVQARPGATGCVTEIVFTLYGIGFPSPHLGMTGLGQGFKGFKMLFSSFFSVKICSNRFPIILIVYLRGVGL